MAVVRIEGHDDYLGLYGSEASREKYRRLIAQWHAGTPLEKPSFPAQVVGDASVSEMILAYLQRADGYYTKGGKPTKEPAISPGPRPLRQLYGLTPAGEFGPLALKSVRRTMVAADLCRFEVAAGFSTLSGCSSGPWKMIGSTRRSSRAESRVGLRKGWTEARESEPVKPVPDEMVDPIRPHAAASGSGP